jgi:hypothetical protein
VVAKRESLRDGVSSGDSLLVRVGHDLVAHRGERGDILSLALMATTVPL